MDLLEPRSRVIGLLGLAGFPFYYFVWIWLFPQPYENLTLRLLCAASCIPLVFPGRWPRWLARHRGAYLFSAITLCIPFFFTYMSLRNDFAPAWAGSSVIAVVLVFYLLDLRSGLAMLALGSSIALAVLLVSGELPDSMLPTLEMLPVLGFALVAMLAFNVSAERMNRAKIEAAATLAGHIAHELRTPILAVRFATRALAGVVSKALGSIPEGARAELQRDAAKAEAFKADVESELEYASMVIDLLLRNAYEREHAARSDTATDAIACIRRAVERYPYDSEAIRAWVSLSWDEDSNAERVPLDPVLLEHVFLNLIKNSIWAIRAANRTAEGSIAILPEVQDGSLVVKVTDNGAGIPRHAVARIFEPFFTTRRNGSGLGLHFVRQLLRDAGGDIRCEATSTQGTTFALTLPLAT